MNNKLRIAILTEFQTQADFSQHLNVHESKVSQVVRGRRKLSPDQKVQWAAALNQPIEMIFPED